MADTTNARGTGAPLATSGGTIVGMGALTAGPAAGENLDFALDRTLPSRVLGTPLTAADRTAGVEIPEARTGDRVGRKYVLERRLARGAMGDVWRALDEALSRPVAIKLVHPHLSTSPAARERFRAEARAAAPLASRHVVRVYDHGETEHGVPFLVMEYLEGETLEQLLERREYLSPREVVRIVVQVARGLDAAHARGIVHRDLKPDNVFLTRTFDDELPVAKVLDFGVAKLLADGSKTSSLAGAPLGTPLFMSPELARGRRADHRTDLYSLGVIVYNALTGSYPFHVASVADLLAAICSEPLPAIRERAPWLPSALDGWFARACAREPDHRFSCGRELAGALERALAERPAPRPGDSTCPVARDVAAPHLGREPSGSWAAILAGALALGAGAAVAVAAAPTEGPGALRTGLAAPAHLDAAVETIAAKARSTSSR